MKLIFSFNLVPLALFFAIVLLCACTKAIPAESESVSKSFEVEWEQFKNTHGKNYTSPTEEAERREIFFNNLNLINTHNADPSQTFQLGVNEYSDMKSEEFTTKMAGYRAPVPASRDNDPAPVFDPSKFEHNGVEQPATVDWRSRGAVGPVKNQGSCGSCWSFSATGALEGQTAIRRGRLPSLSQQNLIDCSSKYGTAGCGGGWMNYAFSYIRDNGGVDTEASYPYEGRLGPCRFNKANVGATDTGYVNIPSGNETALKIAVANIGPISVAMGDSGVSAFQNYRSGVYNNPSCKQETDHAVLIVGYGTLNGADYWLIKNSWGSSWGMNGYAYMSRNKGDQCGITTHASYPTV